MYRQDCGEDKNNTDFRSLIHDYLRNLSVASTYVQIYLYMCSSVRSSWVSVFFLPLVFVAIMKQWIFGSSTSLSLRGQNIGPPQVPLLRQHTRIQCLFYIKLTHVIGMLHEFVEQSAQYKHSMRRSCLRSHSVCWRKSVEVKFTS